MSTVMTSDAIVKALEQRFEAIFREHHDMVFRTAYGVLGNSRDAEDVVQDIFVRLLDRGISPDVMKNPAGFLYRVAVNESLNVIRSRKRIALISDWERIEEPAAKQQFESNEEIHRSLYEAVARLSPPSAQILILRYVHEYSDAEIARLLGKSRGTIAVALYRARARLRKWMRASFGGDQS